MSACAAPANPSSATVVSTAPRPPLNIGRTVAAGGRGRPGSLDADRDPGLPHALLRLPDRVLAIVEDRRAQHGVRPALRDRVDQVVEVPGAAGCDQGDLHGRGGLPGQLELVAVLGPVTV